MRTLIWYTDAITALAHAARPLFDAIEDATLRGDGELLKFLNATYLPLRAKLRACVQEAWREEEWTTAELAKEDAVLVARVLAMKNTLKEARRA